MANCLPLLRELNGSSVATKDFVMKMPKIELHVHTEGSIRPTLLLSIAESNKVNLPFLDDAGFANPSNYRHFKDFA